MTERESFVYFIQAGETGPIKIGKALNPTTRLTELQCGCPDVLRLLGAMPGDVGLESKLHIKFAKHRHRGEWFVPVLPLLIYIRLHSTVRTRAIEDAIYPFEKAEADERARKGKRLIGDWVYEVDRSWRT